MLTKRENFFRTINGGEPDRLCNGFEAFALFPHPVLQLDRGGVVPPKNRGDYYQDTWGTTYVFPDGEPGAIPIVTAETKVIKDITKWEEQLVIPDYDKYDLDWSQIRDFYAGLDTTDRLKTTEMNNGLFEESHNLMGFEDALINHLLYPDEMHAFLDALLEVRLGLVKRILDECAPEVIIHHDDWGSKTSMFMSPDVWREFYKERYRELYGYMTERGVTVVHHGDSFMQPIASDMAEIGIRVWQGAIPSNDIPAIQQELGGRMTVMGGIAADKIDVENWTEEAVRSEVRRACAEYGPAGGFIPSLTYGGPRSIYKGVQDTITDEVRQYNLDVYGI
jgi:hypothetical protein